MLRKIKAFIFNWSKGPLPVKPKIKSNNNNYLLLCNTNTLGLSAVFTGDFSHNILVVVYNRHLMSQVTECDIICFDCAR